MRQDERDELRQRYAFRCGYCGVSEQDVGAELTVDHFHPRSQGGSDEPENWVYSCHACNEFKSDFWQPDSSHRILHPLQDDLIAHFLELEDGTLRPITTAGAFHVTRLNLNRVQLVAFRAERRRLQAAQQAQRRLLDRLHHLEGQIQTLTAELEQLDRGQAGQ